MKVLVVFLGVLWMAFLLQAAPLTKKDIGNLKKYQTAEHVLYEMYLNTDDGAASVFGYHFDTFINKNVYFSTNIFGAVGGKRGGYGIAAFGFGYRKFFNEKLYWDVKAFTGSGGGGGLPAGGGFALEAQGGLGYALSESLFLEAKYGYLTFPTGTFETPIINFGVSYQKQRLFLPF